MVKKRKHARIGKDDSEVVDFCVAVREGLQNAARKELEAISALGARAAHSCTIAASIDEDQLKGKPLCSAELFYRGI